jgi:hypothetical protein
MQLYKKIALAATVAAAALASAPSIAQQSGAAARPARIAGQPNINGVWQAMNSANWNLEAHSATKLDEFWALGSLAAIPAGQSVVDGDGKIPYKPEALAKRDEHRAGWPKSDPETSCYLPGIPRATYMPFPFQIVQGGGNILFVYTYASANRLVNMGEPIVPPVDTWMGQSNGRWEGETLVIETTGFNDRAEGHGTVRARRRESFAVLGDDRRSERVHAALDDQHAAVPAHRAERAGLGVQVRAVRRGAALQGSRVAAAAVNPREITGFAKVGCLDPQPTR